MLDTKQNYKVIAYGTDLENFRKIALIDRKKGFTRYIVAKGYDEKTGTWAQGSYYFELEHALIKFVISIDKIEYLDYFKEDAGT